MKDYETRNIRNVVLASHGGVGKTTLAEAMLFDTKSTGRMGRIDEGNTHLDYSPDEINRKISISLGVGYCEYKNHKINMIDAPGYADFEGELMSGVRVADGGLLLLRASTGPEVGTERAWQVFQDRRVPTLVVVNMMDKEHANFEGALEAFNKKMDGRAVALELPIGQAETFEGIVDLLSMKARYYHKGDGKEEEKPVPDELKAAADEARTRLVEAAAEGDDALLEKFFAEGDLGPEEIERGLRAAVLGCKCQPAVCTSAYHNQGIQGLLDTIVRLLPSPADREPLKGVKPGTEDEVVCKPDAAEPFAAQVFKTVSEPHVGELSLFRVFSGVIEAGKEVQNTTRNHPEKLGQVFAVLGKERKEVPRLVAGDIGAAVKLKSTATGDTLCARERTVQFPPIDFPATQLTVAFRAKAKGDDEKVAAGLHKLHEEDPTVRMEVDGANRQMLLHGMGEVQLDVVVDKLKRKYGVEMELVKPRIPYKETIRTKVEEHYRHKKQTGGRGQFGDVHLRLEPRPRGAGFEFVDEIKGGVVPNQYIPAVEKGVVEALVEGPLAGYEVVDVRVALFFGGFHTVDSSEMAFKIAGLNAFRNGMLRAQPVLLEPIVELEVHTPKDYMGDIMGDLSSKRGKILGMEETGRHQRIKSLVPMGELYKYSSHLRSLTQGRAHHSFKFSHYEEVPRDQADRLVEEHRKEKEAEHAH
ncbi:MAG: elongation factor G [Candidatus Eisenbacteria bacterium]|nr:elongation factor G [Candidatus Eisenbacteria bacterium]